MSDARAFTHRDSGTGESTWLLDGRWDTVPRLALDDIARRYRRVVLVAPHPDDETLSLGATLADLASADHSVTIVITTHGGDGPGSTRRRSEGGCAVTTLGSQITVRWWDLPDGCLPTVVDEIVDGLSAIADDETVLLAPVECDGHGDHEAVAAAAEKAARACGAALLLYPVWLWHWATPDDIDWTRIRTLAPSLRALNVKAAAIACYPSQLESHDGTPVLGPAMLARARRVMEAVFLPAARDLAERVDGPAALSRTRDEVAAPFDAMLDDDVTDPWHLDDSAYEQRRIALTLACLGRPRYQHALEIGCATGQLAAQLGQRAEHVVGVDVSEQALRVARERDVAVDWVLGAAPADIPQGAFDLIVLSEVAYFLDGPDLLATLRAARHRLRPGGEILIATWSAPTTGIPLDGPTVHEQATAMFDLPLRARYDDADLTIQVWGEPVSVYRECADTA